MKRSPMPRRRKPLTAKGSSSKPDKRKGSTSKPRKPHPCAIRSKTHTGPARSLQGGPSYCAKHAEQRADRLFSLWVRARDGRCTAAPVLHTVCDGPLQAAHIVGRRNMRVRYSPSNVHAVCRSHHMMLDQHGREGAKYDWATFVLGETQFTELRVRARQTANRLDAALSALAWLEAE